MNKKLILGLGAVTLATAALATIGARRWMPELTAGPQNPAAAPAAQTDVLTMFGSLQETDNTTGSQITKFYTFDNTGNGGYKQVGGALASQISGGGAWVDGKLYFVSGTAESWGTSTTFNALDTDTWKIVKTSGHYGDTKTASFSMAYDYTGGTMYACSPKYTGDQLSYELRTVDLESGEFTTVGSLDNHFPAMAVDANGQLWGIARKSGFPYTATLYKIDKATGATAKVGDLGVNQRSTQSAAVFDHRTGKLYWTALTMTYNDRYEEKYFPKLMEIDLSTGAATSVKDFTVEDSYPTFYTLFVKDSHPQAPEQAKDLKAVYQGSSTTDVKYEFEIPSTRYNRTAITGSVKAEVYQDGELVQTMTGLTPGDKASSQQFNLSEGAHSVAVYLYDSAGCKSLPAKITSWGGEDVPAAVTDIVVTPTKRGDSATLTWTAPTSGKTGGVFDKEGMTYTVIRRPDMVTVATGLTEPTVTDTPNRKMGVTQYEIKAETKAGSSDPAYTGLLVLGKAHKVTYLETFDDVNAFYSYSVIDVNGIGTENGDTWFWHPTLKYAMYYMDYTKFDNPADTWFISPTIDLKADNVYNLQYAVKLQISQNAQYTMTAHVGDDVSAEAMTREIDRVEKRSTGNAETHSVLFLAQKGDCRIGFHLFGNSRDHAILDNIRVAYYGPATIPGEAEVLYAGKQGEKAVVTVKAPEVNAKGSSLSDITKINLYRSGGTTPVATVENVTPGANVTLEDADPEFGPNYYTIVAENADGPGLETYAGVNMRAPVPQAVENLRLNVLNDGADVQISWNYPENMLAANGEELEAKELTYNVYRGVGYDREVVARNITATTYIDRKVMENYGEIQKDLNYYVVASTSGGNAAEVGDHILVGKGYELPLEIANFYQNPIQPWTMEPTSGWHLSSQGYTPLVQARSNSSIYTSMGGSGNQLVSPRLNLCGMAHPKVSAWYYTAPDDKAKTSSLQFGIIIEKDGVAQPVQLLGQAFSCYADEAGWKEVSADLTAYGDQARASIVLVANVNKGFNVHVDEISVTGEKLDCDARAYSIDGPEYCVRGRSNIYTAQVLNNGKQPIADVTVNLTCDGETVATRTVSLAVDELKEIEFDYTPSFDGEEMPVVIGLEVKAPGDANDSNDRIIKNCEIVYPNVPYVHDLEAAYDHDAHTVTLTWGEPIRYPRAFPVKEDFESYERFLIDGIGDWKVVDKDGAVTIDGIQTNTTRYWWPHCGEPQAWIVFNPSFCELTGLCNSYSGKQCLLCIVGAANDDWLISPQLVGSEQTVSFYARAMNSGYLKEKFSFMTSSTGNETADFTSMQTVTVDHADWRKYTFSVPDGTRYFAIRCTSNNQFGLMLDDIEYVPAQPGVDLMGYNVYRNNEQLAAGLGENEYSDAGLAEDEHHIYHVKAQYADGESIPSNLVHVHTVGVNTVTGADIKVGAQPGQIIITGADGQHVSVVALDGKMLYSFKASGNSSLSVQPGVYVVNAGVYTCKITVK